MYKPTTSRTFSTNCGSFESEKLSVLARLDVPHSPHRRPDASDLESVVREIIGQALSIDASDVGLDVPLTALGVDSLAIAELCVDIEVDFGVTLTDEIHELTTVGRILELVQERTGPHPSS